MSRRRTDRPPAPTGLSAEGHLCMYRLDITHRPCMRPAIGCFQGRQVGAPGAIWHCADHGRAIRIQYGMTVAHAHAQADRADRWRGRGPP